MEGFYQLTPRNAAFWCSTFSLNNGWSVAIQPSLAGLRLPATLTKRVICFVLWLEVVELNQSIQLGKQKMEMIVILPRRLLPVMLV